MINMDLIKNPANWGVVFSMALIGSVAFHFVSSHIRNQKEKS